MKNAERARNHHARDEKKAMFFRHSLPRRRGDGDDRVGSNYPRADGARRLSVLLSSFLVELIPSLLRSSDVRPLSRLGARCLAVLPGSSRASDLVVSLSSVCAPSVSTLRPLLLHLLLTRASHSSVSTGPFAEHVAR